MEKKTPESIVKEEIKFGLDLNGFFHFHILQGLGCYPGAPDRVAIKDGITIYIEVKTETGIQSEKQKEFQKKIVDHQGHYILARSWKDILNYWCEHIGGNLKSWEDQGRMF